MASRPENIEATATFAVATLASATLWWFGSGLDPVWWMTWLAYARFGDWFAWLCLATLACCVALLTRRAAL